jgi:type IV pilus assembly protein PilQ
MTMATNSLKDRSTKSASRAGSGDRVRAFLFIGIACTLGLVSCSINHEKQSTQTAVPNQPSSTSLESVPSAGSKDQVLTEQTFSLQELSAVEERGQTTLFVKFSQPVTKYRHFTLVQPSRIVLDVFGDVKPVSQAESFRIDTKWLATLKVSSLENTLRLVADVAGVTVPVYTITSDENGLKIVIGALDANASAKKNVTLVRAGKRTDVGVVETGTASAAQMKIPSSTSDQPLTPEKSYTGQKITLEFKDADIKNVFRILGEVSGKNILVTDDVNKKVTIRLIEVPWDQALDLIIDTNGLAKEEVGSVMRISTAARISKEKRELQDARKAAQSAEIPQISYLNVNYAKAKDLTERVKQIIKGGAEVVPDDRSNTIIVRGSKMDLEEVIKIVTRLDVRTPQVLIESNLIETTPTFARSLGLRFRFSTPGGTTISSAAGAPEPYTAFTPLFPNAPIGLGGSVGVIQNAVGGIRDLASTLEAAEREGNIRIMSRPSVVTLNNVASTIRSERILRILLPASTNIATGTGSSAAGAAIATEQVRVGIILTVTPQVSSDGFVLMNINVKSSTLGAQSQGSVVPDELNREASAQVLVKDGETIVIGGILKDTSQDSESGVPYLKDVPVLGWLFKNQRVQKDFEELMVFITPRLTSAGSENLPVAEHLWREQMRQTEGGQATVRTPTP